MPAGVHAAVLARGASRAGGAGVERLTYVGLVVEVVSKLAPVDREELDELAPDPVVPLDPDPAEPLVPAPDADTCPVDPSEVLTAAIRCGPGRNTTRPSATEPVCKRPSEACQRSTAPAVSASKVPFTDPGLNPRRFKFALSSCTS
jgi:hypothetical protein